MQNFILRILNDNSAAVPEFQHLSQVANEVEKKWQDLREKKFQGQFLETTPATILLEQELIDLKNSSPRSNYDALLIHFYLMTNQNTKAEQIFDNWLKQSARKGYREGDWAPIAGIARQVRRYRQETLYLEIAALAHINHQVALAERFYAFLEKMVNDQKKSFTEQQVKLLNGSLAFLPERAEALAHQLLNPMALIP